MKILPSCKKPPNSNKIFLNKSGFCFFFFVKSQIKTWDRTGTNGFICHHCSDICSLHELFIICSVNKYPVLRVYSCLFWDFMASKAFPGLEEKWFNHHKSVTRWAVVLRQTGPWSLGGSRKGHSLATTYWIFQFIMLWKKQRGCTTHFAFYCGWPGSPVLLKTHFSPLFKEPENPKSFSISYLRIFLIPHLDEILSSY